MSEEVINNTLAQMPASESLVLRLYYLEENSVEEVSSISGLSNSNVKVILYRARKRFCSILKTKMKHELNTLL
jgi:RNA polymerase sigma-70 factor (ECF subfamily)